MKPLLLSTLLSLSAIQAMANVPTMTFPDLVFPAPQPDISTQNCLVTVCK